MSRIGQQPITIPDAVKVSLTNGKLVVQKDNLELTQKIPSDLNINIKDNQVLVTTKNKHRQTKALHGLIRSLAQNMIIGLTKGFTKTLELHGTGYRAVQKQNGVEMTLGFSHPVSFKPPENITLKVLNQTTLEISGADKQLVGQTAASIRQLRPPDAYKGKGVRYQGETVKLKPGKSAKAAEGAET